jgi:hypothetical protein
MAEYRVYLLNSSGKASARPIVIEVDDDMAAVIVAREIQHPEAVEIWAETRLVGQLPPRWLIH